MKRKRLTVVGGHGGTAELVWEDVVGSRKMLLARILRWLFFRSLKKAAYGWGPKAHCLHKDHRVEIVYLA
jgi:hypothetical protein